MSVAYVDASCIVAIAFDEPGGKKMARRLEQVDQVLASNLLEAEVRAAFRRENVEFPAELINRITWVLPDRRLTAEIRQVLRAGYVRGADCFHLATALYLAGNPGTLPFLTLDAPQAAVAARLGFPG